MKLTRKLLLALLAGIVVVLALAALSRIRRETELFREDMARDHVFVGRTLRAMYTAVWRADGEGAAFRTLREADASEPRVRVRAVSLAPGAAPDVAPEVPTAARATLSRGDEQNVAARGRFYTYLPLVLPDAAPRALELSESLHDQDEYVRASVVRNVFTTMVLVLVCAAIAAVIGYWFVGRPMSKLTEKARRVGAGDLTGPLVLAQHDEIAEFAGEMNAMCDRLAAAQKTITAETAARIAALEQLRHADRLRTVGQLASGLAHELGTPLNVVLGRARMIAEGGAAEGEIAEHSRIIVEQAQRMATLIRQLLDFARRRGPQMQVVDLSSLLVLTRQMLATLAEKQRVSIATEGSAGALAVAADPHQLQQAITNLAVNGIQAMAQGGTLTLRAGEAWVSPPAEHGGAPGRYRFVSVTDAGSGIAPVDLGRIFEPFFTTKDVGVGTGLGLSVAFGIVRDHGGWIEVQSTLGQGSTFTIFVPPARPSVLPAERTGSE